MSFFHPPSQPGFKGQPVFNAPPFILWLCGLVLLCSVTFFVLGLEQQLNILRHFALVPKSFLAQFSGNGNLPTLGGLIPLITHVLLHADFLHLIINLGFLLAFGTIVERSCGGIQMMVIFLVSAIVGATVQVWSMGPDLIPIVGASGGVYGLMGATLPLLILGKIDPRLRRVADAIIIMMILNLFFAVTGVMDLLAGMTVAWVAHFGGFATGAFLGLFSGPPRRRKDTAS